MPTTRQTRKPTKAQLKKIEKKILIDDSKALGNMLDKDCIISIKCWKNTPKGEYLDEFDNDKELDVFNMLQLKNRTEIIDLPYKDGSGGGCNLFICMVRDLAPYLKKNLPNIFHKYPDLILWINTPPIDGQELDSVSFQLASSYYVHINEARANQARAKHWSIEEKLDSDDK